MPSYKLYYRVRTNYLTYTKVRDISDNHLHLATLAGLDQVQLHDKPSCKETEAVEAALSSIEDAQVVLESVVSL